MNPQTVLRLSLFLWIGVVMFFHSTKSVRGFVVRHNIPCASSFCSSRLATISLERRQQRQTRLLSSSSSSLDKNYNNVASSDKKNPRAPAPVPAPPASLTIFYNDIYHVPLPPNHRFPMEKYGKVRRRVQEYIQQQQQQQKQKQQLSADNATVAALVDCRFYESPLATVAELQTTHDPNYIQRYIRGDMTEAEQRNVGFPWSQAGVRRSLTSVGGTLAAARHVLQNHHHHQPHHRNNNNNNQNNNNPTLSWAAHVAGGTHHAFYNEGEGFCQFSDMAVAANVVLEEFRHTCHRILLCDLDVHQGNGNAKLFANRSNVFTFSMHCVANYFSAKQTSDLDIELPADCRDETYLLTLQHWLTQIERQAGQFDLVLYQAGVDGLAADRLGRMALTARGLQRRDQLVYDFCYRQNLPLVITMGGGYPRTSDWEPILASHAAVYTGAYEFLENAVKTRIASVEGDTSKTLLRHKKHNRRVS